VLRTNNDDKSIVSSFVIKCGNDEPNVYAVYPIGWQIEGYTTKHLIRNN